MTITMVIIPITIPTHMRTTPMDQQA
jgi:hypothetical protein